MDELTEEEWKKLEKYARKEIDRQYQVEYLEFLKEEYKNAKRQETREYRRGDTKSVGDRLEDVTESALKFLQRVGVIKDFKRLRQDKQLPDFIVNGDIAIECKNWNPKRKTKLAPHTINEDILSRFGEKKWGVNWRDHWNNAILLIPKLAFKYKEKECRKLLKDLEIIEEFPWVSPNFPTIVKAQAIIMRKLNKLLKK